MKLTRTRRFPTHAVAVLAACCLYLIATWWIYPFVKLKTNPGFNSDSASVLLASTEPVPLAENIFQWGVARNGSFLSLAGRLFYRFCGAHHLRDFIGLLDAFIVVAGCTTFIACGRRATAASAAPVALVLVLANFNRPLNLVSFAFTISDVAHRPEAVPFLVWLSWLLLSFGGKPRSRWLRPVAATLLACLAVWVTDLALVAGVVFCIATMARCKVEKTRIAWQPLVIWVVSLISLQILRRFSAFGAEESRALYRLPDWSTLKSQLPSALRNVWITLTPVTWIVVFAAAVALLTAVAFSFRRDSALLHKPGIWQSLSLFTAGMALLSVASLNQHVYANQAHVRYFTPGLLLLCIAAAQAYVSLGEHFGITSIAGALTASGIALPLVFTAPQVLKNRHELANARPSALYRAGEMLGTYKAQAVIGEYWQSYAYVLARPGALKAVQTESPPRSPTNAVNVLTVSRLARIEYDPARLVPSWQFRGKDMIEVDNSSPVSLPTHVFFKLYDVKPALSLVFGNPDYRIYLRDGWSGDEADASHSWVWAVGKTARIQVPLDVRRRYAMKVVTYAPAAQQVTVWRDNTLIGSMDFDQPGRGERPLLLPARLGNASPQTIEFRFAHAVSVRPDPRKLALSFETIQFEPLD